MTMAKVGAAAVQKVGSSTPPSSISMLVLGGGIFMLMMGLTGGKKYKLPAFSVPSSSTDSLPKTVPDALIQDTFNLLDDMTGKNDVSPSEALATLEKVEANAAAAGFAGLFKDEGLTPSVLGRALWDRTVVLWNQLRGVAGVSDSTDILSDSSWVNPLTSMTMTQAFKGLTTGTQYISGQHRGEDYKAKYGTPAYSVANATVVGVTKGGLTRVGPGTYTGVFNSAYGPNSVELLTDSGYSVVYGHFSDVVVAVGQKVQAGQLLGHTGSSTGYFGGGDHLHIEVTKTIDGVVQWFRTSVLMKGAQNPANVRTDTTTGGVREY